MLYNLESSDDLAEYRLIIDLQERQAFVCPSQEAVNLLAGQWQTAAELSESVSLSPADLDTLFSEFVRQVLAPPTLEELERRMEVDRRAVETLTRWLNNQ